MFKAYMGHYSQMWSFDICEKSISSTTSDRVIGVYPVSLTWQGHEFLETSRNDTFWNNAKTITKSKSGGLSIDIVKALLIAMVKESVGLK